MDDNKKQVEIITIETGNLLDLMRPGILALVDYSNGRAYLSDAVNVSDNLMRQYKLIAQGQHTVQKDELSNFKPVVLKFVDDPKQLKYAYADMYEMLTSTGMKVISRKIKYNIRGIVQEDFRSTGKRYLYYVYLYSQRKPVKLLGVFNNCTEADGFVSACYPSKSFSNMNVIVSDNELTKLYLDMYKQQEYVRLMGL